MMYIGCFSKIGKYFEEGCPAGLQTDTILRRYCSIYVGYNFFTGIKIIFGHATSHILWIRFEPTNDVYWVQKYKYFEEGCPAGLQTDTILRRYCSIYVGYNFFTVR